MSKVGSPPEWLGDDGREMWETLEAELPLEHLDRFTLTGACMSFDLMTTASKDLKDRGLLVEGDRGKVMNRANQIYREAADKYLKFCAELGLSPAARQRMEMELGTFEDDTEGID